MRKTILGLKIFHLSSRTLTLLLVALLITLSTQLVSHADTSQLLLSEDDFKDSGSLAVKLQDTRAVISQHIAPQLSSETRQLLGKYDGISSPSLALQKALISDLNKILQAGTLYDAESFADIELSEQTLELLEQNPQSGEALVRLNRLLLADVYPYELAPPSEKQNPDDSTGIERCRENLRQIKLALENHRAEADGEPQWLSELVPQYLEEKVLLCPADTTVGIPGVLTEDGSDPTLPCSYLYQFRPDQKKGQELLLKIKGDMLPIVRCQHHLLNLSVSGKIYRNGPQRKIYNNSTVKATAVLRNFSSDLPEDIPAEVRKQVEAELLKGGNNVKVKATAIEVNVSSDLPEDMPAEAGNQVKARLLKGGNSDDLQTKLKEQFGEAFMESPEGKAMLQQLSDDLRTKLKEQFGEAFMESPEGKALLQQLMPTPTASIDSEELALLLGKPMPDIALTNLSGKPVKLETLRGKFVLVNLFSTDSTTCGPKLKQMERLLANYDATQLQAVGISTDDSAKAIEAFKEKHQLSMPLWMDKNDQIRTFLNIRLLLNKDASEPQTELITLLLNRELIIKDVFVDVDPETLSTKIKDL